MPTVPVVPFRPANEKPLAPAPSPPTAAAQRARERRLAGVARVVANVGVEIAHRARRVAAGQPVIVNRSRRAAAASARWRP